jgi:hypothetical protein
MLKRLQVILGRHPTLLLFGWILSGVALWVVFQRLDPNVPGQLPSCAFTAVTGVVCPGCGTTRAMHALAQGRLLSALTLNPLIILSIPLLMIGSFALLLPREHRWSQIARRLLTPAVGWIWVALLLTLWAWRLING